MRLLARPWAAQGLTVDEAFGPADCLIGNYQGVKPSGYEHINLLSGNIRGSETGTLLFPYPKREEAEGPCRKGFPVRPRPGHEPVTSFELEGAECLQHMNQVLARVQELEGAIECPGNTWERLRNSWKLAEDEAEPQMGEIVRQARSMLPVLRDMEKRIRRVLRRHRELTPLDRVQEMDRTSMIWISRQPGRTIPERAGSSQRILATVRRENFDTLENRVLHAYTLLAADVAREWMREHQAAKDSVRFKQVESFRQVCRVHSRKLSELGVMIASAAIQPNYVLMQDRCYREIYNKWQLLRDRKKIEDDLWSWQAETWTDFSVLSIVLAIDELEEAELIAQSPISWHGEAIAGRWFQQDRPIAVFWLRDTNRIVEVQTRPERPGTLLSAARAHVALRISDPTRSDLPRRVAVWTPHALRRIDLEDSVQGAAQLLQQIQALAQTEVLRNGLIMTPARGVASEMSATNGSANVTAIAIGPAGQDLSKGLQAVRDFIRCELYEVKK